MKRRLAHVLKLSAVLFAAAAPATAAEDKLPLSVTNATERVVFCTFLFDGKSRTKLAIRPGRTWSEAFDPRRTLQLVCNRGIDNVFGPLEAGRTYKLVEARGHKVGLARADEE